MSVEFEDEQTEARVLYSRFMPSTQLPKLVGWVIKAGIVKNENQANYFLISVIIVSIILSIYFILPTSRPRPTFIEDIPQENLENLAPEILNSLQSRSR